jgi:transposase
MVPLCQSQLNELKTEMEETGRTWTQAQVAALVETRFRVSLPRRRLFERLTRWGLAVPGRRRSGGLSGLSPVQLHELRAVLETLPREQGYVARRWSRRLIAEWVARRFGVRYTRASIPKVLRRAGCPAIRKCGSYRDLSRVSERCEWTQLHDRVYAPKCGPDKEDRRDEGHKEIHVGKRRIHGADCDDDGDHSEIDGGHGERVPSQSG